MITIYRSRYVVPVTSKVLERGAIAVENGRIIAVDSATALTVRYPDCRQHDYGDAILLPAFNNAHTHLELSHYSQWAKQWQQNNPDSAVLGEHAGFVDWIIRLIEIKKELGFDLQSYKQSWQAGLDETLATGTGQCGDILSVAPLAELVTQQLSGCCFIEAIGQDLQRVNQQLQQIDNHSRHCNGSANPVEATLSWGAAPHSPYTLNQELLRHCYRVSTSKNYRTTIHIAESADEELFTCTSSGSIATQLYTFINWQQYLPKPRNIRPLQVLEQSGGLRADTLLVHGVHLNNNEIKQLAKVGCSMVLCPRSNARLNVGKAPAVEYLRAGVALALGTDSLASNDSLSLWDEMEFAHEWFNGDLTPQQLLYMCTVGGARAIYGDVDDGCGGRPISGQLTVGAAASFQVVKPQSLPDADKIYQFLCNAQRSNEVQQLVVNGVSRFIASNR